MELPAISQHEQSLIFRAQRNAVLASNIANADTPNYKARDLQFGDALNTARQESLSLQRTSSNHIESNGSNFATAKTVYRTPLQPSLDGNTVQLDVEQAEFAQNAIQYRASLAFLDGNIRGLRYAIKGGD